MMFKGLVLVLAIIFGNNISADTGEELLAEHQFLREMSSTEIINKYGKNLADKTQRFLNSDAGKSFAQTDTGKALLHRQKWLINYNFLTQQMNGCAGGQDKRQLGERILQASLNFDVDENCDYLELTQFRNDTAALVELEKDMQKVQLEALHTDLWMTSMRNTLITRADHVIRYKLINNDPNTLKQLPGALVQEACYERGKSVCGAENEKTLREELTNYINQTASKIVPQTPGQVVQKINSKLISLNKKLKNIKLDTVPGYKPFGYFGGDTVDKNDPYIQAPYQEYQQEYAQFATKNEGLLLMSETLQEKEGSIRTLNESDMNIERKDSSQNNVFTFKEHEMVEPQDIDNAIKEVDEKIAKQIKNLRRTIKDPVTDQSLDEGFKKMDRQLERTRQIRRMVKYSPAAVAESLMNNPENAGLVCKALTQIQQDDEFDAEFKKYAMYGGMIVGGALLVTGVGAGAGAALLAGSAGAAATLTTVATGTLVAGTVLGIGQATLSTAEALSKYNEANNIAMGVLTQNSDPQAVADFKETYLEFKDARFEAALAIGMSAADLGALKLVTGMGKNAARTATEMKKISEALKKVNAIYKSIGDKVSSTKLAQALKMLGKSGNAKMDEFLIRMSQSGEKTRLKFLEKLKGTDLTPEKLKKMIDESLEASKKCVKK